MEKNEESINCAVCKKDLISMDHDRFELYDLRRVMDSNLAGLREVRVITKILLCKPSPDSSCVLDYFGFSEEYLRTLVSKQIVKAGNVKVQIKTKKQDDMAIDV